MYKYQLWTTAVSISVLIALAMVPRSVSRYCLYAICFRKDVQDVFFNCFGDNVYCNDPRFGALDSRLSLLMRGGIPNGQTFRSLPFAASSSCPSPAPCCLRDTPLKVLV